MLNNSDAGHDCVFAFVACAMCLEVLWRHFTEAVEASCTVVESSSSPRHAIAEFPLHWGKVLVFFLEVVAMQVQDE